MSDQGPLFRICCKIIRAFRKPAPIDRSAFPEGVVYLCRHSGASGPVHALAYMPIPVRPWILDVFFSRDACYHFFSTVTYHDRFGHTPPVARFLAWISAAPFARLVRSTGGIPVYRHSLKSRETFRRSVETLDAGESLLIFPDVNYAEKRDGIGALYRGFLMLEKLYFEKNGRHISFVPLHIGERSRALHVGRAIQFRGEYRSHSDEALHELTDEFNRLEAQYG